MSTEKIIESVKKELDEMRKLGVNVPNGAYREAEKSAKEYSDGGMSISEIASLCIELGGVE